MIDGFDLSVANDSIYRSDDDVDFNRVYGEGGKRFGYLKATEAEHYVDPQFLRFVDRASQTPLKLGAYTFIRIDQDPNDDVENFLVATASVVSKLRLAPMFDFEVATKGMTANQTVDYTCGWMKRHVKERGCGMILYSYTSFLKSVVKELGGPKSAGALELVQFPLCIAQYSTKPPDLTGLPWDPKEGGIGWTMWQHSASDPNGPLGTCPGVKGYVDLIRCVGNSIEDMSWLEAA